MKFSDIFLSVIIILMFVLLSFINTFTIGMNNIKSNWPKYRCSPSVIPFAGYFGHDPVSNFTYCIQNMQTSYIGELLKPTNYIMTLIQNVIGDLLNNIQWIRKKIDSITSNFTNIIGSILGIFINIMLEFQKMIIKLKDTMDKLIGTVTLTVYLMDTGMKTGSSIMAGPIGKTLRFVCFHPKTKVKLMDHTYKEMDTIEIGDILSNGAKVEASMIIRGNKNDHENLYYKIYSNEYKDYIYVTGSHYMQDPISGKFLEVKDYKHSVVERNIQTNKMSCLIVSNHIIPIGEYKFWDWEDNEIKENDKLNTQ